MPTATIEPTTAAAPDLAFALIARFLPTLDPDPNLAALAAAYQAAHDALADARQRRSDLAAGVAAIDRELPDAAPNRIDHLLADRAAAAAKLPGADAPMTALERQCRTAHLAYLARVRALALVEVERVDAVLADPMAEATAHRRTLYRYENAGAARHAYLSDAQVAEHRGRIATIVGTTTRPLTERRQRAEPVAKVAEVRGQNRYGAGVALDDPGTWNGARR